MRPWKWTLFPKERKAKANKRASTKVNRTKATTKASTSSIRRVSLGTRVRVTINNNSTKAKAILGLHPLRLLVTGISSVTMPKVRTTTTTLAKATAIGTSGTSMTTKASLKAKVNTRIAKVRSGKLQTTTSSRPTSPTLRQTPTLRLSNLKLDR